MGAAASVVPTPAGAGPEGDLVAVAAAGAELDAVGAAPLPERAAACTTARGPGAFAWYRPEYQRRTNGRPRPYRGGPENQRQH